LDPVGRHWIVRNENNEIIAAARMTLHDSLDDGYRDVQLWKRSGKYLPLPTVDLGRLVVLYSYRGRGIAQMLNVVRIEAARQMQAKSIMVTASEGNARLLRKLGFEDIGETIFFSDRPGTLFIALQLNL
jgi:predicted GNAT family N-acyltransferase